MSGWLARAAARFAETPPTPTDKTDERGVSSVSSVQGQALPAEVGRVSSVSSVGGTPLFANLEPLTAQLIEAVNRACDARGDDDAHRAALIEECAAQPLAMQADLLAHFVIEAARWGVPDHDDRVTCATCRHHRALAFRCSNYRAAGLQHPDVSRDLAELLQHCPGFAPRAAS